MRDSDRATEFTDGMACAGCGQPILLAALAEGEKIVVSGGDGNLYWHERCVQP